MLTLNHINKFLSISGLSYEFVDELYFDYYSDNSIHSQLPDSVQTPKFITNSLGEWVTEWVTEREREGQRQTEKQWEREGDSYFATTTATTPFTHHHLTQTPKFITYSLGDWVSEWQRESEWERERELVSKIWSFEAMCECELVKNWKG